MSDLIIENKMHEYLASSQYIDWTNDIIQEKANEFRLRAKNEIELIRSVYEYVRDEICIECGIHKEYI